MSLRPNRTLILVANNPFGHHLLTSQLLDHYRAMALDTDIILLCNGIMSEGDAPLLPGLKVIDFASRFGGVLSYVSLLFRLVVLRLRHPRAAYHLRGFVSGLFFYVSRLGMVGSARYIYDPRGAFFVEWREAGKSRALSRIFGWAEARLTRKAQATIVTSHRFARLYRRLFGRTGNFLTIYNSTSFPQVDGKVSIVDANPIRLVYLGTFNEWHDMGELVRVMSEATLQLGPDRVEIYIFTPKRFHETAQNAFGTIDCQKVQVDYVNYKDVPNRLAQMHVGVSVIRPTLSTRIASPIKISDYISLGLVPLLNEGIGDFDDHFRHNNSAILYPYKGALDLSNLASVQTVSNREIFDVVSQEAALRTLRPVVDELLKG